MLSTHGPPVREDEKKKQKNTGWHQHFHACLHVLLFYCFTVLGFKQLHPDLKMIEHLSKTYYLLHFDFNLFKLTLK